MSGSAPASRSEVSWRLRPATDVEWLDTVLEDGVAASVEDHHGGSDDPQTIATVVSIVTVHCRFAPEPVAGSGIVTPSTRRSGGTATWAIDGSSAFSCACSPRKRTAGRTPATWGRITDLPLSAPAGLPDSNRLMPPRTTGSHLGQHNLM
ncbi:DUF6578 domain-containing protein [Actinoplanes regularis]|uniref:DUF6578 domain-containing protein n=1 Tax=Actinoplanes regularis TaxID=52697 RepID=UPI003D7FF7AE